MYLYNHWYVAAWSDEVAEKPFGRTILGQPIVLYRKGDGAPVALEDRCPHRRVPLSMGQVIGDELQCGYHGLRFNCDGKCTFVPGQSRIPPAALIKKYPVIERYRWLWVWMGDPSCADPSLITDFNWLTNPEWGAKGNVLHVKCNWQLIVDNLLDLSHLAFVHTSTIGNTAAAVPTEFKVDRHDTEVVVTRWICDSPPPPSFMRTGRFEQGARVDRWQIIHYTPPAFVRIDSGATPTGSGARDGSRVGGVGFWNLNAITPETETTTNYFWAQAHNFEPRNAELTQRVYEQVRHAFLEDVAILEAQQRLSEFDSSGAAVHIASDAGSNAARRLVDQLYKRESDLAPTSVSPPSG